jgi:1,4-dihydroxy-2-naphthoate octaprenyltransferase
VSLPAAAASVLVGLTTTGILFCSHFHQIEGDLSAGKQSPLVRLGASRAFQARAPGMHAPCFLNLMQRGTT